MSSSTRAVSCCSSHKSHLFAEPLCEDLTLLRRIANVAFHVLTLGVPLALYHITSLCSSRKVRVVEDKSYSSQGAAAIEFTIKELEKDFVAHGPINYLMFVRLLNEVKFPNFLKLIEETENPFEDEDVLKAADECMKISFAVSNSILDEMKSFSEFDSGESRLFYCCPLIYQALRTQMEFTWKKNSKDKKSISDFNLTFYEQGKIQCSWKDLYNEYCDRVKLYAKKEDLDADGQNFLKWTKKDEGPVFEEPNERPSWSDKEDI